jgi:penicillin-binding protein 1C
MIAAKSILAKSIRIKATITFFIVAVILSVLFLVYWFSPRPELNAFVPYSTVYVDKNGELLRLSLAEDDRYRIFEPLENISSRLIEATILYEDQNFYDHGGIDIAALFRAFWTSYILQQRRVGASTIVMQVARLRWGIVSNTFSGKIHQLLRAVQLTRHFSKQEILTVYFNLASYGRNIEGVGAASLIYFGKKPSELSLPEALTLAVIPQNPNKRNPTLDHGYQQLLTARSRLFERWLKHYPEDNVHYKYIDLPLQVRRPEQLPFHAPHFVNHVNTQLPHWQSGYIETSLDLAKQHKVESILTAYIKSKRSLGINNAAALLLNYKTMAVEAMVGSADFYNASIQGQVNGTKAKRSPGSTLKPFVYGLAMDEGLIHPLSLLRDSPRKFGGFTPENYDKQFLGPVSAKQALISSRNVPAVDLQSQLRQLSFHQFLVNAGISDLKEESFYGLALALGGGELTMLELVSLYAALANKGVLKPVISYADAPKVGDKRILSGEASFLILDILKDNSAPDTLALNIDKTPINDIAWKTGTSWAFRDAWAVGVSGSYVLAIWVGNFDGKGNNSFVGRSAAGPLLFSIFDAVISNQVWSVADTTDINSLNIKQLLLCRTTGDLYGAHCPSSQEAWFIPGVSPIKVSTIYRQIPIHIRSGLRACWHVPGVTEWKTYEFWPSDFLQIFNQAGIALKRPPEYASDCGMDQKSTAGQSPVITSPQNTLEYIVRANTDTENQIPLKAIVDPDVTRIHWFINDAYIGSAASQEVLLWEGKHGEFTVRAVDDSGRSASKQLVVKRVH